MVQHPGKEPSLGRHSGTHPYLLSGNTSAKHHRKFMENNGDYVDSNNNLKTDASLRFWGEYEMASHYILNPNGPYSHANPKAVHYPIFTFKTSKAINTDPLVFGDYFCYFCCKLPVVPLNSGDIVLFGTYYPKANGSEFHLDTFFIVKERTTMSNLCNQNNVFRAVNKGVCLNGHCCKANNSVAYVSFSYYDNHAYYSFVPCKKNNNSFFDRPIINNYECLKTMPDTKSVFDDVVLQVRNQGYDLGVKFHMP